MAAVAYAPLLLTSPGWVSADTKVYLYLDPGQLLARSRSMWDPTVGMGTVPHQRIGFLWPMAPYYWLAEAIGLPDWLAQRIWWGTIIFAAGAGVAYLLRVLGWRGPGATTAVFLYALSPYVLTLVARLSGVLLPFAGLPWLLAFTIQGVRHRGWRYPALFALTLATFGSVNASGLLLVCVAPVLWLPYAVWGAREASARQTGLAALKIAVLTVAVSAWWIAGLDVQRTNGLDIIRYSETAKTVATTSVSHEVLRGLGYWFFYGRDRLGRWVEPGQMHTQSVPLIAVTFLVPLVGITGAALARWRHRAFFVGLVVVGTALAVGAYPWDANPPFGRLIQRFQTTDAGLAMRSLPRAVPVVALGIAVLAGSGVASVVRRWPRLGRPAVVGSITLALLALPALWLGRFVPDNLRRPSEVPGYWRAAADHLDARDDGTRVLVVPGSDFAAYFWGTTVDPVLPGLMDRPSVQREKVPNGSPASANLLDAFDLTLQEGTADPDALAAVARLMRAGDVLVVNDWLSDPGGPADPQAMHDLTDDAPGFGRPVELRSDDADTQRLPGLAVLPVDNPVPLVSTHPAAHPLLVAGDGAGLVDAAAAGLIDGTELIHYSATLDPQEIDHALEENAALLLTDSNRRRGERWDTLSDNRGYTETAEGEPLATDLGDNRLPVFPGASTDTMSVAVRRGIDAEATSYGNAITYVPDQQPIMAVDGDTATAWQAAAYADARGERLELALDSPVTTDHVRILQPSGEDVTRHITRARLTFDGTNPVEIDLTETSQHRPETVTFPEHTFSRLSIEIVADSAGDIPGFGNHGPVGFSEIEIGGIANLIDPGRVAGRLPTDLLDAAGRQSVANPLAVTLTRQREHPSRSSGPDEEEAIVRVFALPGDRSFALSGTARLSLDAAPEVLEAVTGLPREGSAPWARSSDTSSTAAVSSARQVFDDDPTTAWSSDGNLIEGQWVEVSLPAPATIATVPLTVVADGEHSVPTEVVLSVDGREVATRSLEGIAVDGGADGIFTTTLDIPPVTGSRVRLTISEIRRHEPPGAVYGDPTPAVAIAEIGLPGPTVPRLAERFDSGCRRDLLTLDDQPVPVRVTGRMADAVSLQPLTLTTCGDAAILLHGGDNRLQSTGGGETGIDVDQLVLRSAAGGHPSTSDGTLVVESRAIAPAQGTALAPTVEVIDQGSTRLQVHVSDASPGQPFWLVHGQSFNTGWAAHSRDGGDLGAPALVDGFANGWLITPQAESFDVDLEFRPQRRVDRALWISLLSALACLVLALRRPGNASYVPPSMPEPMNRSASLRYPGLRPPLVQAVAISVGLALGGWFVAGLAVGTAVGLAAGVGTRRVTFRRWLLAGSVGSLALTALYVLYVQVRHSPIASLEWPHEVGHVHPLGWLAVLLLAADVAVDRAWRRRRLSVRSRAASTEPDRAHADDAVDGALV